MVVSASSKLDLPAPGTAAPVPWFWILVKINLEVTQIFKVVYPEIVESHCPSLRLDRPLFHSGALAGFALLIFCAQFFIKFIDAFSLNPARLNNCSGVRRAPASIKVSYNGCLILLVLTFFSFFLSVQLSFELLLISSLLGCA